MNELLKSLQAIYQAATLAKLSYEEHLFIKEQAEKIAKYLQENSNK